MKTDKTQKEKEIRAKYADLKNYFDERTLRVWAAAEINQIGKFGKTIVKKATGLDYKTLNKGLAELSQNESERLDSERVRKQGGGRKKTVKRTKV